MNIALAFNDLPRDCLGMIADRLEGSDLRSLKLTRKCMRDPVSDSQRKRIYSAQLALPAISRYGLGRAPGQEIETLYVSNLEDTKKIVTQLKVEGRLSEINSVYYWNNTPLSAAYQNLEKMKVLVEEGEAKDYLLQLDGKPGTSMSALGTAAGMGNVEAVRYLLSQGAQVNALVGDVWITTSIIPALLDSYCDGVGIHEEVRNGNVNVCENQFKCLALILSYTKDLAPIRTQRSLHGQCPVEIACIHGRQDLMELLLNFGFQWSVLAREDARKKLFINAVVKGHLEIVRWFVNTYKMDVNFHDDDGITLLHMAKAARKEAVVDYLLSCGANPEALTNEGQDYQTYANLQISVRAVKALAHYFPSMAGCLEFESFQECYACLMDHDINRVIDEKGNTLLHIAAAEWLEHEDFCGEIMIPALMRKGADLTARNNKGQTPYDVAIEMINLEYSPGIKLQEMHDRVKLLAI